MEHEELTHSIIGAAMEVHSTLGPGFLEGVYQEALEMELVRRGIRFIAQQDLEIQYKGVALKHKYKPDFMVDGRVVVEIKAATQLTDVDMAQAINYLKATGYKVALVINFGGWSLEWRRVVY
jgi:GxxExxY protein